MSDFGLYLAFHDPDCRACGEETSSDGDGWFCECCRWHWPYEEGREGHPVDDEAEPCKHRAAPKADETEFPLATTEIRSPSGAWTTLEDYRWTPQTVEAMRPTLRKWRERGELRSPKAEETPRG